MKSKSIKVLFLLTALACFDAFAVSYEIIGPCSSDPVYFGDYYLSSMNQSIGSFSIALFKKMNVPYIGSEAGLNSILNTPVGLESTEIISDTKMRAYGWCFSLNGVIPTVMPNEVMLNSNEDKVVWFYGYSTYDNGQWTDYCEPSYKIKAAQFCAK